MRTNRVAATVTIEHPKRFAYYPISEGQRVHIMNDRFSLFVSLESLAEMYRRAEKALKEGKVVEAEEEEGEG